MVHAHWMETMLKRNSGGAHRDVANASLETQVHRGSGLLCFTCSICFILSLICTCLATLLVLLDQKVEAASYQNPQAVMNKQLIEELSFRLPSEVKPCLYDIYLYPDLEKGTFQGKVMILIDVFDTRSYIAVHQKDLNITSTQLKTYDREENYEIEIEETIPIPKNEMFVVSTKNKLHSGLYNLSFEFNGALQPDKIVGFYSSKYKSSQNQTRLIATSKFEPTYARRAFPCFDEPAFKAEFAIQLVHPSGDCYNALSNMNVEKVQVNQPSLGLTTVTFATSSRMSTYLSCFIVSDFVAVTSKAKNHDGRLFPISVYTTSAQKEKGTFALDIAVSVIQYYISLFDIGYPLPKLDLAAIPDFVSGAMENWGLVTFRESRLLYDNKTSSTANKYDIVSVICHELAHMWFGNLVTMAWWNDLWLNEGFATFMQYKSANAVLPDWGWMDRFPMEQMHTVFVTDAKLSSHPIVQIVSNPDEITAIFDDISYQKGSSIIRMMEDFITPTAFYRGIHTYLNKFQYDNAETADLLTILADVTWPNYLNVKAIMDTWTKQMGYPVVNVKKSDNKYILTQKRFLADPDVRYNVSDSEYGYTWTIPITYITNKTSEPTCIWFDKSDSTAVIELSEPIEWIKFNANQVGYYRVNYELTEWETLNNLLRYYHKRLSVSDRTNLLEDAFSLAAAQELDYSVPMNMTAYLPKEHHAVPWKVAELKLGAIDTLLSLTDLSTKFKKYVRNLVDSVYHEVAWTVENIEDHVTLRLRSSILELACSVGHEECLEEGSNIFKSWIQDPKDVRPHPDIRALVYYYGMHHVGDEASWNTMFQRFLAETDSTEKLKLMQGLAGIRSDWILNKFITTASDENYVRSQDFFGCLSAISNNPVGTPLVWNWVRSNWELLVNRYTLNDRYLGALIPSITKTFATETKLDEIEDFFAKYPEAGAGARNRAKALETVSNNIKWLAKNTDSLRTWLNANVKTD
ncbi:glutamyl aminopeptidase [Megalopta genalis]|uniref:glutamyl aminopeptidase n=1 Tax=Megalopta genalis TaxID=115081 RepID=UPI0014438555|nr:glutamyl aminopeptidase-like [Megalopta genalis]XP_033329802.1 glutamyl aminopeptidase-like [Megalopta genalis]XP_033329803.1 glutamyl aminopeptidase-like [Megalopta genalis]XP_033329804.1 glutamyl aminopeptidase-like [Megalopta genalis]XP_033329805.1 glutamyl aminopeptidase-like [Megalopta genalis]